MTTIEIEEVVRNALHDVAPDANLDNLRRDDDLRETVGLDSLDFSNSSNCSASARDTALTKTTTHASPRWTAPSNC